MSIDSLDKIHVIGECKMENGFTMIENALI